MNGEAVDRIAALAQINILDSTIDIDGEKYSTRKLNHIMEYLPRVETLHVSTLTSFAEFINGREIPAGSFIHVVDHLTVEMCSEVIGKEKKRESLACAVLLNGLQSFSFGQFMPGEEFIIALRSLFVSTPDLDNLISYTGKVNIEDGIKVDDDGISQSATVKRGISGALKGEETAPVVVTLAPYRTFREIAQPASEFLFRMRDSGGAVQCALFEADGGMWRLGAVSDIKEWLVNSIPGIEVYA